MLWPEVWFGTRFVLPILPIAIFFFAHGIYQAIRLPLIRMGIGEHHLFVVVILPFVLLYFAPKLFKYEQDVKVGDTMLRNTQNCVKALHMVVENPLDDKYEKYFEIGEYVKANLDSSAVICTRKPSLFYLKAERYVTMFTRTSDKLALIADLKKSKVTHVVVDQLGYKDQSIYLIPALQAYPEKFTLVTKLETSLPEDNKQVYHTHLFKFEPDRVAAMPVPVNPKLK